MIQEVAYLTASSSQMNSGALAPSGNQGMLQVTFARNAPSASSGGNVTTQKAFLWADVLSKATRYSHSTSSTEQLVDDSEIAFAGLFDALRLMSELDAGESMHIDEDTYRSACSVLNFIRYYDLPAPRVFAHGGDAVVFNWAYGKFSLQLTVSNGFAVLGRRVQGEGSFHLADVDLSEKSVAELFPFVQVKSGHSGTNRIR